MANPEQQVFGDAFKPAEIAQRVQQMGVAKARASALTVLVLSILAGAFISLGALLFLVVITGSELGFGLTRLIGGLAFCLGLVLVVIGGAELFTGNNLLAMAWASKLVDTGEVLRNWLLVYIGNVIGCLGTIILVLLADTAALSGGAVGNTAVSIAAAKADLGMMQALVRGVLCNALVCMAVWLALGGHSVTDKFLALLLPISAFVALGFEHSIANWFFLPYGMVLDSASVSFSGAVMNLILVSIGNILGGTLLVAGVYWLAYLRPTQLPKA